MNLKTFTAFITEGLNGESVAVAPNGEDFEMRVREVPDLIGLALKCARLGIREVQLEAEALPETEAGTGPIGLLFTFRDAVDLEFKDSIDVLTSRERQVMVQLAAGKTNREVADDLSLSIKTIDTHRGHLLKKLGLRNNSDLTRFAMRNGIVQA